MYILYDIGVTYCFLQFGHKYKYKKGLISHLKYECGIMPKLYCRLCQKSCKHSTNYKLIHYDFNR